MNVERPLTGKQKKFIDAYLDDGRANFNATDAARFAGYSGDDNTLAQRGHELLVKNSKVKKAISLRLQESAMSANETLERIGSIGRDISHNDQLKALGLIAKHHGLLTDKIDLRIENELENLLEVLESNLDTDTYERVIKVLAETGEA